MISSIFVLLAIGFLNLVSYLPTYNLPENFTTAINSIINMVLLYDGLIQIRLIFHIIGLILIFELTMWAFRILVSIFNFVRGSGSIEI